MEIKIKPELITVLIVWIDKVFKIDWLFSYFIFSICLLFFFKWMFKTGFEKNILQFPFPKINNL